MVTHLPTPDPLNMHQEKKESISSKTSKYNVVAVDTITGIQNSGVRIYSTCPCSRSPQKPQCSPPPMPPANTPATVGVIELEVAEEGCLKKNSSLKSKHHKQKVCMDATPSDL